MGDRLRQGLPDTFVLWDVDHTLIEYGGVSKETYVLAFERLTGQTPATRPVTHGRTDFQIMCELLAANGVAVDGYTSIADFEAVLIAAMKLKAPELPERGHVVAGVVDALQALRNQMGVIQSVLTGNIAPNAFAKLSAFGLDKWVDLKVGGFGSDDEVRLNLVGVARRKLAERYGKVFDRSSTVLIGDTLLDVQAARDGGAKVIAVATGVHEFDKLAGCGADATLHDLSNLDNFLATLVRVRTQDTAV
ncbi:MAG: HAD family hydrolase [Sciscionella sp.]